MRRTKIVCTMGPNTNSRDLMKKLIETGMDVARFNFSHGDHDEQKMRMDMLKELRKELKTPVAILLDTKGPEIRTGVLKDGKKVNLVTGQTFTLTTVQETGDENHCSVSYTGLTDDIKEGDTILIDDGLIGLRVEKVNAPEIVCTVVNGGELGEKKGVNVPNVSINLPNLTEKDKGDLLFGIEQDIDFVAASFIRNAEAINEIREFLVANGGERIDIIAKIENQEGVSNLVDILSVADGIMVARGDMGVEIDFTEIPAIQKSIIAQCVAAGKPVITATQMLDSMIENPRPTRAEITDVANAIYDGTSAIMLSGETAAGKYPVEAVRTMDAIARKTESNVERICPAKTPKRTRLSITAATAHAACTTAEDIGADAILTVSQSGATARLVSRFRPGTTVVALLLDPQVQRQMALYWGLVPITMPRASSTDQLVDLAIQSAQEAGLVKHGDLVVVTAGVPVGISGTTNMIRIAQVGGALVNAIGIGSQTASGPLCICRTLEEIPEKFHPGDVLVVPYTNNDVVPWLRQAAAIVSEEASADCHTATVGLLLNKPVIVAASDATRRLKDGTLVSVDCARGIVQTIPQ